MAPNDKYSQGFLLNSLLDLPTYKEYGSYFSNKNSGTTRNCRLVW